MSDHIKMFREVGLRDVASVGGKNASLGEMFTQLLSVGIKVPDGFATTASAFSYFIRYNEVGKQLQELMQGLDKKHYSNLTSIGSQARNLLLSVPMPADLEKSIINAYKELCGENYFEVAVRSSATAEDLPQASFAGQHESYLNIKGEHELINAVQRCFASLYTDRAIKYREDNGFKHEQVLLSVGVQKMIRSDLACAGVGFTLEPESGFRDVIHLSGVWGLGENIVQGTVTPDEFFVFKPTLKQNKNAIIQSRLGDKAKTMIYAQDKNDSGVINIETPIEKREQFVLDEQEIIQLAKWALAIEEHYARPMDIEWAKDGITNEIFII